MVVIVQEEQLYGTGSGQGREGVSQHTAAVLRGTAQKASVVGERRRWHARTTKAGAEPELWC